MRRASPIIVFLAIPWVLALTVPPIADEFKYREFGITQYPGWSVAQLQALGAAVAAVSLGCIIFAMWLFVVRPPPLRAPHTIAWIFACLLFAAQVVDAFLRGIYIHLGSITGALGIYLLFALPQCRFWKSIAPAHPDPDPSQERKMKP